MNSRGTPGWIFLDHPPIDHPNLGIDLWPAKPLCPRSKAPEQSKAGPMPGHNGLGFDDDQNFVPRRPEAAEKHPKQPIPDAQPRTRILSLEYAELLTEGKDLKAETVAAAEKGAEAGEERTEEWHHGLGFIAYGPIPAPP